MHSITVGQETIPVRPNAEHVYLIETALVAKGYGVDSRVIRDHKSEHADELVEGKHWVTSVGFSDARGDRPQNKNLQSKTTYWTKRGVARLGFFIKSQRAKLFRDAAEDLIIAAEAPSLLPISHPAALRAIADLLDKGALIADAYAQIAPRTLWGSRSKSTGQPRTKLVPSYFRTGRLDGFTRNFLETGKQLDLGLFLGGAS